MKKEYILLIVVILGLSAYLVLKKDNRVNYELPALAPVDTAAIDQVRITRGDRVLTLSRADKAQKGEEWTVGKAAYPASQSAVEAVLETIKTLRLSALVSESGNLVRYDLDPDNALHVTARDGETTAMEFFIGKTAPSFNHTFVMLKGDDRVFQADQSFRDQFDKDVEDFRDKVVLTFKPEDIKKITLEKKGLSQKLVLNTPEPKAPENETEAAEEKEPAPLWMTAQGEPADQGAVQDLLASLSRLECQGFKDGEETRAQKSQSPACKIRLENGTTRRLHLFASNQGEDVPGTSSGTPFAFDLASYEAADILSYVDKVLGIEKKEATPSDSN